MDENALRAAGIDYDAALARFMGKQAIYEKYLQKLPEMTLWMRRGRIGAARMKRQLLEQVPAIKGRPGNAGDYGIFLSRARDCCALTCRNARRTAGENDVIKTGVGPRL